MPFMFMAQEIALRLGLGTQRGAAELVLRRFGRVAAIVLLVALATSCFGALVSELSGLAGAAQVFGVPIGVTMVGAVVGLVATVVSGSYRSVERVGWCWGIRAGLPGDGVAGVARVRADCAARAAGAAA
jgi:Mn2+/Fe2+ NRAMP family transporter